MDYNWCHNPDCHKIETQSRVRGTGDNKVLRTRKIALNSEYIRESIYAYFCNQCCLHQFLNKFASEVANLNPTPKPKETPIKVKKEKYESYRYRHNDNGDYQRVPYQATRTTIVRNNE
tara:strand:+ start:271 stop:624 length:354 start_codon:yes stop_codon:yes gene_type:complete